MDLKTNQIRLTLEKHYIEHILKFREELSESVWTLLIENILKFEENINNVVNTKYLSVLEQQKFVEAHNEFSGETARIQSQTRRFREAIERIREGSSEMNKFLQSAI